jgi:YVTN family beta-propeller protein
VVNTVTNQLSNQLTTLNMSLSLAISPDGQRLYVNGADSIWLTDVATNEPQPFYAYSGANFEAIALSPDGRTLYAAENLYVSQRRYVTVIDTATKTVTGNIYLTTAVNNAPEGVLQSWSSVAVSPDGGRLYVLNPSGGTMDVIDTTSKAVISTVPVGATPHTVAVSPDGKSIYVTNQSGNTLTVISNFI